MGAAHLSVRTACNRWPTACGKEEWDASAIHPTDAPRAVREYLDTLDKATFGAASEAQPKFTSHSDPASQWTAARKGPAFFSYSDNYLIDTDHGVIVAVEATRSIRQAEVGSTETMLERVKTKSTFIQSGSSRIPPMAPRQCWAGWSTTRSRPTFPYSTSQGAMTGHGPAPTLNRMRRTTNTFAPRVRS